jgi:hypothetical protein
MTEIPTICTDAQVRLKTASRPSKQAGRQDIHHNSKMVTRRMQWCGSIGARPALAAAEMHSRRRATGLQCVIWITGRVQRVVVRLVKVGLKWAHWWRRGRVVLLAVSSRWESVGGILYMYMDV